MELLRNDDCELIGYKDDNIGIVEIYNKAYYSESNINHAIQNLMRDLMRLCDEAIDELYLCNSVLTPTQKVLESYSERCTKLRNRVHRFGVKY